MIFNKIHEGDFVVLNVSGVRYQLKREMLHRFPGSLLDNVLLATDSDIATLNIVTDKPKNVAIDLTDVNRTPDDKQNLDGSYCAFVQRSPKMFELIVLNTYVTGRLHVPRWMCPKSVLDELKFWRLDVGRIACGCCTAEETDDRENAQDSNHFENLQDSCHEVGKWNYFRRRAWNFCANPATSIGATIFSMVSFTFLFMYSTVFIANSVRYKKKCMDETMPLLIGNSSDHCNNATSENCSLPITSSSKQIEVQTSDDNDSIINDYSVTFFTSCAVTQKLHILEAVCIVWFTLELLSRLIVCPSWRRFFRNPLNVLDVIATAPYYVDLLLIYFELHTPHANRSSEVFALVRILRCLCILRILKLAVYFEDLRILGNTLKAARDEFYMLGLFVFIAVFIFSSIMYQLEMDEADTQYTSILASCWWGIVTLTTVGYGDIFPKTIAGKLLASIACITGIIVTAFPTSILVEHFIVAYKRKSKARRMFLKKLKKENGKKITFHAIKRWRKM